jgi:RNA polymerase sigma-70 factor (ECF subfamily)
MLARRVQASPRDSETWGEIWSLEHERLYRHAFALLRDRSTAEEVVQETFVQAFKRVHLWKPERSSFRLWLHAIINHTAMDLTRRRARERHIINETAKQTGVEEAVQSVKDSESFERLEYYEAIRSLLSRLPDERQRHALILRHVVGLTIGEIAELLDLSPETVSAWMSRAMRMYREELEAIEFRSNGPA